PPASLMLAPSNVFCSRLSSALRSRTSVVRYRVSSRNSRWGRAGTKLGRSKPCRNRSAIHSLSFPSVFRPGTALMCWALTKSSARTRPPCPRSFPTAAGGAPLLQILVCVLPTGEQQAAVPQGLPGPTTNRARDTIEGSTSAPAARLPATLPPPAPHFHPAVVL